MNFHLTFPVTALKHKIDYSQRLLFIGSCFAENMAETMRQYKFNVKQNPHGVLYNPASMAVALRRYIDNNAIQEHELFFANECWNSWEHHSRFSNTDKQTCLIEINNNIETAHNFIKQADWLFITFGSAFIYKINETGQLVGNCHKVPQKEFTKSLLNTNEIVANYQLLIQQLKAINNKLKIIFTVSPVRYIRDGVVENTLSKARLIEAAHALVQHNDTTFYFPAYELMMDDLRDYRFYKTDLVHPNEQAIAYIFEKLTDSAFTEDTKQLFEKIKDIITAHQHRPFQTDTQAHKKFKDTYSERCKRLQQEFPDLDLTNEIEYFKP